MIPLNHKKILELGWKPKHSNYSESDNNIQYYRDEYIMVVLFDFEYDLHLVNIQDAEGVNVNQWENSERIFHGMIKTTEDLRNVMRYTGIIDYYLGC